MKLTLVVDMRLEISLFANIGNVISFRTSAKDGHYLTQEMFKDYMPFTYGDFVTIRQYHIVVKMMIEGNPTIPFTANTMVYSKM